MPVELQTLGAIEQRGLAQQVQRRAERMLSWLGLQRWELSLVLCDDPMIHDLNRRFRRINKPTDVLAFPASSVPGDRPAEAHHHHLPLGDIVISVDTSQRQASREDRPLLEEITMLLAHGLLHLLAQDHRNSHETRRMRARTDLLHAVGNCRQRYE